MVENLVNYFSGPWLALFGPFLFLLLCAFGFPMPEDIVLVGAGLLGEKYGHPFWLVASITYAGILIGDGCIFMMGAKLGTRLLKTRLGRFLLKESTLLRAEAAIERYGSWVIFGARFLPGLRTAVFFSSGMLKFSFGRFLLMDGLAALISAPLFVFVGKTAWHVYQSNAAQVDEMVEAGQGYVAIAVAILISTVVLILLARKFLFARRRP